MDSGLNRAVLVWHRRAGKDKTAFNWLIRKMYERKGSYYYFLPTYSQGRKIIWDGMDRDGFAFLDHFPKEIVDNKNSTTMKITLDNGSIFQIIGTDKIDSIMGTNPVGCIFSEYSIQDPQAWDYIRPILKENGGFAVFVYTPRGPNHGRDLYEIANKSDDWFCQKLTIEDTGVLTREDVEDEMKQGMSEEMAEQEFYCSFQGSIHGAYYAKQIAEAEKENRFTSVPYERNIPVDTFWDLGIGDAMSIWFCQVVGNEIHLIDYIEGEGEGLQYYAKLLQDKGYIYGEHHLPHDAEVRELGTGKSRREVAEALGIKPLRIVTKLPVDDGINAARAMFNRCWFDETKCERGISALKNYQKDYDEKRKIFKNRPFHNWASHGADAFRYLAVGLKERRAPMKIYRHGY